MNVFGQITQTYYNFGIEIKSKCIQNSFQISFLGLKYCMNFKYFIQGQAKIDIFGEDDIQFKKPLKTWTTGTGWTDAVYTFTAITGKYPVSKIFIPLFMCTNYCTS